MKVCVDIQAAIAQRAGVGRYAQELVQHLPAHAGEDALRLFYFDFQRKGMPFNVPEADCRAVRWIPGRIAQGAWKTLNWPPYSWFSGSADVYHFPNFIRPPLHRGRSVVTVHDVSFLRHPETTEAGNLRYLNARIRQTVQQADAIITDSAFSAGEIEDLLGVSSDRLFPIHLGLPDHTFSPSPAECAQTLLELGLDKPFLLSVGTLEPRKNFSFLIDVFEQLGDLDLDLVIAGMQGWKCEPILDQIRNSPRADHIRYLDYVDDRRLAALYGGAELFVFTSIYEGFGFTPLEAMVAGTPVISSPAGSLGEVLDGAAVLVEGYEAEHWAAQVRDLIGDSSAREDLVERGRAHINRYTWDRTARETWQVYREVAR